MAKVQISLKDAETRAVWECALQAKREVDSWPAWKRGDPNLILRGSGFPWMSSTKIQSLAAFRASSDLGSFSFRPLQRGWVRG